MLERYLTQIWLDVTDCEWGKSDDTAYMSFFLFYFYYSFFLYFWLGQSPNFFARLMKANNCKYRNVCFKAQTKFFLLIRNTQHVLEVFQISWHGFLLVKLQNQDLYLVFRSRSNFFMTQIIPVIDAPLELGLNNILYTVGILILSRLDEKTKKFQSNHMMDLNQGCQTHSLRPKLASSGLQSGPCKKKHQHFTIH